MTDKEKIIRAKTLEDFNRELGRHGGDGHGGTLKQAGSLRRS